MKVKNILRFFPSLYLGLVISFLVKASVTFDEATKGSLNSSISMHWSAPFYSGGGYSSEALAIAQSFDAVGISIKISNHGDSYNHNYVNGLGDDEKKFLRRLEENKIAQHDKIVSICHAEPGAWYVPNPRYRTSQCPSSQAVYKIGRTMFETDRIPDGWASRCNYMDEIWVPTQFSKLVFSQAGVDKEKLFVISEPVDTNFYRPVNISSYNLQYIEEHHASLERLFKEAKNRFVFLFVGKWEKRKGIRLLLRAFFQEFQEDFGTVTLAILTSAYHSTSDFKKEIKRIMEEEQLMQSIHDIEEGIKSIQLLVDIPHASMPLLYSMSDVLVIPSHGEGWGRPHVEAMSCGVPVIATNWSGPTEFITQDNGYPLRILGMEPVMCVGNYILLRH